MQQVITLKLELWKPTKTNQQMYERMTEMNTAFANWLLTTNPEKPSSKTFKQFSEQVFPSVVACQTVREVQSKRKHQEAQTFKRMWCEFNNQNLRIDRWGDRYTASFPTQEKRIGVPLVVREHQKTWLDRLLAGDLKQGSAKLVCQRGRWFLLLSMAEEVTQPAPGERIMGVDLGLRYLAVAAVGTKTKFFSGREAAFVRRRYAALRKELGKAKKLDAIRRIGNKEQRWMTDQNHKISRQIINFAIENGVGVIRMENLTDIRITAKRRNAGNRRSLHNWAFYQLQQMIEYKAELTGIRVEYVNPMYTSQTCRHGHRDKKSRQGIEFCCTACGDHRHADANAALNIGKAISGMANRHAGHRSAAKRTTAAA